MNSASIKNLRQKFEKEIDLIRNSDFNSLQQTLLDFWDFFDNKTILVQIREDLIKQFPDISAKVYQILYSPSSVNNKEIPRLESIALASEVLREISKIETNSLRGTIQSSVSSKILNHPHGKSQDEIDEYYSKIFKDKFLNKFSLYVDEMLEELESQIPIGEEAQTVKKEVSIDPSSLWNMLSSRSQLCLPISI